MVKNKEAGFSLLELVVALSLLSLLMVLAYSGLRTVIQARERTTETVYETQKLSQAHSRLRGWLQNLSPLPFERVYGQAGPQMYGDDRTLSFVTRFSQGGRLKSIKLSHDPQTNKIILKICPDFYPRNLQPDCQQEVFLEGVQSLKISYLFIQGSVERWGQSWNIQTGPPRALKIEFDFLDKIGWNWPPMLTRVLIKEPAFCNFSAVVRKCS